MNPNLPAQYPDSAYQYGVRRCGETHGVVLTKPHIADLMLDLSGYGSDKDLARQCLLEPACGKGAFLIPAVRRLLESAKQRNSPPEALSRAILAYDIDPEHVRAARNALFPLLVQAGIAARPARKLLDGWVKEGDFLLAAQSRRYDYIVGNPPYVRIEQLAASLQSEYRSRYRSLFDRADLYVAFIERALGLLSPSGVLCFVCADRWTLNRYGAPLRALISSGHALRCYVDLHNASPFESDVIAYPSIFAVGPGPTGKVPVAVLRSCSPEECSKLLPALRGEGGLSEGGTVEVYDSWFKGDEPWVLTSPKHLQTLRALEERFAPIEDTCHVGIGVATGNDDLYIVGADANIEPDRLVPLVMREDLVQGRIRSAGRCVINTFDAAGRPVDLSQYPKLNRFLWRHSDQLRRRHVARKNPGAWYRTIDRVYPSLVGQPKLLFPDIAGSNEVAFDEGHYHPHHNLYFITTDQWDLEVLGGLLSSRVALFFVWSYAVKMRGGYLRFQAQYLRRIRVPAPDSLSQSLAAALRDAFRARDFARLDDLALQGYGLDGLSEFPFVDTRK